MADTQVPVKEFEYDQFVHAALESEEQAKQEEFIKTFNICGTKVDLGLDDYGQCYFIEWEENGEKKEMGLGTYCFDYLEQIYYLFDLRYQELSKKDLYGELTDAEWSELNEYDKMFEEEYKQYDEGTNT